MSSDKQCEKHCHFMFQVCKEKLIYLIFKNKSVPKIKTKVQFQWVKKKNFFYIIQ